MLIGAGAALVTVGSGMAGWRAAAGSMAEYQRYTAALRSDLTPLDLEAVVRYATLAANGHNTQPWQFYLDRRVIELRPDFRRRTPVVDPDNHYIPTSASAAPRPT